MWMFYCFSVIGFAFLKTILTWTTRWRSTALTTSTALSAHPCRQFAEACGQALDVNERLIKEDQLEYQEEMRAHYRDMLTELSGIMNEQVSLCNDQ